MTVALTSVAAGSISVAVSAKAEPEVGTSAQLSQQVDDNTTAPTNGTDYFQYPTNWPLGCCFGDLYRGTVHYTLGAGAPAVFHFTGTEAVMHGVRDVDQGIATYSVDGGAAVTVDHYAATRSAQATLFDTGALSAGAHTVTITATGTKNAASTNDIITTDSAVFTGPVQPRTFGVDLTASTGPVTGGASGSLYGQYQNGVPSQNLVDGFGQKTLDTKAQDGQQHPGADALDVEPSFLAGGGLNEYIYMTDVYRNFPYERTSAAQYQTDLRVETTQAKSAPNASKLILVPFNEPDGNWYSGMLGDRAVLHSFEAEWLQDVRLIRSIWPTARIAGPNTAGYDEGSFSDFLKFSKANDVMPTVITWHELGQASGITDTVQNFRDVVEPAAGVSGLPVNIDEYAAPVQLDDPAQMVPWIATIERSKVDGDLAYWRVDGTLGDSVAQQNTPNAQWWLYNWYTSMRGQTVAVSAPNDNADQTPQGLATLDPHTRQSQMILSGGGQAGPMDVVFDHVPAAVFGTSVHVTVQADRWSGNTGAAAQPSRVSDVTVPVHDGLVTIPVTVEAMAAYRIILSPGGGSSSPVENPWRASYEAEDATLTGSGYNINSEGGDATSGGKDVGGLRTGSSAVMTFHAAVPSAGDYTLRVFDGSASHAADVHGPTNIFVRVDGGPATQVFLPVSYNFPIWNNVDTTLHLSGGRHTIALSATGDNGATTSGDAIIDRIDLIADAPAAVTYEAEQAQITGGVPTFAALGQSGAGAVVMRPGKQLTFYVNAITDGYADIASRVRETGLVSMTVNGTMVGTVRSAGGWMSPVTTAWLQQGINKVVLRGSYGKAVLDDLTVTPHRAGDAVTIANAHVYPAEDGTRSGHVTVDNSFSQAHDGVVTNIGPGGPNALTISVAAPDSGAYVATFRFANAQELPSNHYNPDLMVRSAMVSVNGHRPITVAFGPTYSVNQFFTVGAGLTLAAGVNTVKIWSVQQYNYDGHTVGTVYSGDGGIGAQLRTNQAANLDEITVARAVVR